MSRNSDSALGRVLNWARVIRRDVTALYFATRDSRVPWYAKAIAFCVAAYALSPIDLIPDFIPVIGYLDDVLLVPLGILLAVQLIPAAVMNELRAKAESGASDHSIGRIAAIVIVLVWLVIAATVASWLLKA